MLHSLPRPAFEVAATRDEVIDVSTGVLLPEATMDLLDVAQQSAVLGHGGTQLGYTPRVSHRAADNMWSGFYQDNFGRKAKQSVRYSMLQETHAELIYLKIRRQYKDQSAVAQLREYVSIQYNLAIDVTKRSAVAFRSGMRRSVEGATEEEAEAFQELVAETKIAELGRTLNQASFFVGPVTSYAVMRGGQVRIESQLPQNYDIVQDPDDPEGTPLAIAYPWRRSIDGDKAAATTVVLDGHSFRVFDSSTKKMVREIPHGLGHFPGHTLKSDIELDGDFWSPNRHQRVVDGTIRAGVIDTALDWTRKSQSKKLAVFKGNLDDVASQQAMAPERPLEFQTPSPGQVDVEVFDFDTDPKNAHAQIDRIKTTTLEAYDILSSDRDDTNESNRESTQLTDKALTERRSEQVPPARVYDRAIMRSVLETALKDSSGHRLKDDLPSLEKFDEGYTADFGLVSRSFADPKKQIEWDDKEVARGHASNVSLMMDRNPGLSEKKAEERVLRNMKAQTRFNDLAARRDMPLAQPQNVPTPEDGAQVTPVDATMTASEINGRSGPQARMDSQAQKVDA